jgi:hypothetical protein
VDDEVVRTVVRRVLVRVGVERDPPVVRTEGVRVADVAGEEVGAVGGREDHVLGDQRPRAEVEPVAVDLDLQSTHVRESVRGVGSGVDDGTGWAWCGE